MVPPAKRLVRIDSWFERLMFRGRRTIRRAADLVSIVIVRVPLLDDVDAARIAVDRTENRRAEIELKYVHPAGDNVGVVVQPITNSISLHGGRDGLHIGAARLPFRILDRAQVERKRDRHEDRNDQNGDEQFDERKGSFVILSFHFRSIPPGSCGKAGLIHEAHKRTSGVVAAHSPQSFLKGYHRLANIGVTHRDDFHSRQYF